MVLGTLTMLAQHLHHEAALSFVWSILNADIAAVDARLSTARIACSSLENRLQCTIVQLTCEAVATAGRTVGIEGIVDEEGSCIKGKRCICRLRQVQSREGKLECSISVACPILEEMLEPLSVAYLVTTRFYHDRLAEFCKAYERLVYAASRLRRQREAQDRHDACCRGVVIRKRLK